MSSKIINEVAFIGVELEGGWNKAPSSAEIYGDGSVDVAADFDSGEVSSPPLTLPRVLKWITHNYPHEINDTCGLHIHVSFTNKLAYMQTMNKKFYSYFVTRVKEWAEANNIKGDFWNRLKGKNSYCLKEFYPDLQSKDNGNRYTQLNYCFRKHGTLECRLFPLFHKPEISLSAVELFVDICNTFLKHQRRERKIVGSLEDDGLEENYSEVVMA